MRYSIVASALLGAGAALAPVDTGLTCQLPPNELLVGSEQCQGGLLDAKTVLACHAGWDASRGGLLSLSKDATACILTGFEALQVHDLHVAPVCNQTQMDACAKVMFGHLSEVDAEYLSRPALRETPAEMVAQRLKGDAKHDQALLGKPPRNIELQPFARRQQPRSASARRHANANQAKVPSRNNNLSSPKIATAQEKQPASTTPRIRSTSDLFSATATLLPSAPGNKHFAGMACALAIVSLIFVIWM
ncbi:hypothetical protein HYQ44_013283 [Verticillium longisporum]|nr:hypothetical protein HYQ44_013283 [Verticillium longisporum]